MKDQTKALLLGISAVLIWSTVATAFKITLRSMDPLTMVFITSMVSIFSIALASLLIGRWKIISRTEKPVMLRSILLGLLNPFVYYMVLFGSYDLLPAQIAQSINYSWPVILTALSILVLRQRTRARSIAGILLGFTGVVIVSTRGFSLVEGDVDPFGVVLAVGSALIWAIFWTLNLRFKGDVESKLFFNFLGGSLLASVVLLVKGSRIPEISGWTAAAYVGIFEMGITFLIWMKALSLSKETARISMLIYLSPFVSLIFIATILGEPILVSTIAGLILIVTGLIVQGRPERKKM